MEKINWITDRTPYEHGFYAITVERRDKTRFFGYGFFDPIKGWLTANRKFHLDFDIVAWSNTPKPYDGPIVEIQRHLTHGE